jgi:N-acetylglucosaminyldiphosphoundecaprenol N-acetyl-beta-D-mannosaminyltransferase
MIAHWTSASPRVDLAGVEIDPCSFDQAVEAVVGHARSQGEPAYVVTPNAQHVVLVHSSCRFREIYNAAWLSVADGVPLVWAAKLLGMPLPERVAGVDLMVAVCEAAAREGLRVFLLGGSPGSATEAAKVLKQRFPGLVIAGVRCPRVGFEKHRQQRQKTIDAIRRAAPDILFVGLGCPKQEYWMLDTSELVRVPVSLGVGGSFEFICGRTRRAPVWMQKAGLEWFFRILMEPGRLWKRYAEAIPRFIRLVMHQFARTRARRILALMGRQPG